MLRVSEELFVKPLKRIERELTYEGIRKRLYQLSDLGMLAIIVFTIPMTHCELRNIEDYQEQRQINSRKAEQKENTNNLHTITPYYLSTNNLAIYSPRN